MFPCRRFPVALVAATGSRLVALSPFLRDGDRATGSATSTTRSQEAHRRCTMRDLDVRIHPRVKGRAALTRRLAGLLVAVHRYARCRATTCPDQRWAARVL